MTIISRETYGTRIRVPLPACASEREFTDKVLGCLEPWFKVEREVTGIHICGDRVRIDAVISPLNPSGFLDPDPAFGVEFKHEPGSMRDRMAHAAQAADYTYVDWRGHGRLGIFMCAPGKGVFPVYMRASTTATTPLKDGWADPNFFAAHLLGQFTVGELCYLGGWSSPTYPLRKWALLIHGDHILWSAGHGVEEASRRTIRPKVGSR